MNLLQIILVQIQINVYNIYYFFNMNDVDMEGQINKILIFMLFENVEIFCWIIRFCLVIVKKNKKW